MPYAFAIGQSNEKLVRGLFQCLSPLRSLSGICRDTILKVASTPPVQLAIPSFKLLPHVFYRCFGIEAYEREKQKDHMLKLNPDVSNISFFDFDQSRLTEIQVATLPVSESFSHAALNSLSVKAELRIQLSAPDAVQWHGILPANAADILPSFLSFLMTKSGFCYKQ